MYFIRQYVMIVGDSLPIIYMDSGELYLDATTVNLGEITDTLSIGDHSSKIQRNVSA